ncbi:MAG: DUF3373 domain-containing protein [Epsilonproteobacteria bacterium]|nr:DUF3373 domain-containing protein [Campylobacterota bacterium]
MKKIITMSLVVASMAMAGGNVNSDLQAQIDALKAEVAALKSAKTETVAVEQKSGESDDKIAKLEEKISEIKKHDSGDNIKFDVDFRTAIDSIDYKMANGTSQGKNDLFSNRLWLNMAYAPTDNVIFKGQLAANKAFGADFGNNRGADMDRLDWVTNETLTDNSIKLRQAYWLYMSDDFMGTEIPWTMSVGRRPSTTGFLSNIREDDAAQSPLGHIIDVEFDGASSKFSFGDKVGVPGMALKFCLGQGSTNASPRFTNTGTDYADSANSLKDITLGGIVFTPYDDGQFKLETTAFRGANLPGYTVTNPTTLSTLGDVDGAAASLLVDGLDDDNEFLFNTKVFASYAMSKTRPDAGQQMLGSTASETGTSYWLGTQFPVEAFGGKLGLEYNHGSKYWRSFTYGEDTMAGSKLATRGDAYEAHYTQPITEALSAQLRYTKMNYDYTGSNGFFGAEGTPMTMAQAQGFGMNPVESAEDIRAYIRYRY